MDGELKEAMDTVIRSSSMQIIGYHIQNPWNTIMYILSVVRFRITPAVAPYVLLNRCTLNANSHFTQL